MITAHNQRQLVRLKYSFNFARKLFAGVADLAHVLELLFDKRNRFRPFETHVAEVAHRIAETFDSLLQTRDPQRRRTDIDAGHALSVSQRNAENRDCLVPDCTHRQNSTTQIEIKTTAAATLTRKEGFEQTCQRREIARLNQQLARSAELRDDSLATHHTAEEPVRRLAQRVLRRSFPRYQVSGVHHVALARSKPLAMDRAERRHQQQSLSLDHEHKQSFTGEERLRAAPLRIDRQARIAREIRARLHKE